MNKIFLQHYHLLFQIVIKEKWKRELVHRVTCEVRKKISKRTKSYHSWNRMNIYF